MQVCGAIDDPRLVEAVHALRHGQLVGIPTETVYGLAANALNADAVANIFAVKQRPHFDPLIVHLPWQSSADAHFGHWCERVLHQVVADVPDWAYMLAERFWPGPLTLVLPRRPCVPDLVTAGLPTVGVRVPNHTLTQALLQKLPFPLAAPSANPFGYVSPTTAEHVMAQLGADARVRCILDGGPCQIGIESTIMGMGDISGTEPAGAIPTLLRLGGITQDDIEHVIGPVHVRVHAGSNPMSPGQTDCHYAPRIPMVWEGDKIDQPQHTGALRFSSWHADTRIPRAQQIILSPRGDLHEAARHVFAAMRELDGMGATHGITQICAERCPNEGLGLAINDRLERACRRQLR